MSLRRQHQKVVSAAFEREVWEMKKDGEAKGALGC